MCVKSTVLVISKPCCTSGPAVRATEMFLFHSVDNTDKWHTLIQKKVGELFEAVQNSVIA